MVLTHTFIIRIEVVCISRLKLIMHCYYHSMQDLIKAMNKVLAKDISDNIKLTYNNVSGKVTVQLKSGYQLFLNERLSI